MSTQLKSPYALLVQRMSRAKTFEDMAKAAVKTGATVAGAQICTFWRAYTDGGARRLRLAAAFGVNEPYTLAQEVTYGISRRDGITGYVASSRGPVLVRSFQELRERYEFCHKGRMDPIQWKGKPRERFRNLYAVPLTLDGVVHGVLKVENRKGGHGFNKSDLAAVDALCTPLAVLAKSLQMLDWQENRLIEVPATLADALVRPFDTAELTDKIVGMTAETLDAKVCSLWLVDESGKLHHKASRGFAGAPTEMPDYLIYPDAAEDKEIKGITAWVATRRKPFWANSHAELRKHVSWQGAWDPAQYGGKEAAATGFHSMYAVPLLLNNELLGVLKIENPRNRAHFTLADHRKCDLMANYVVLLLALTKQLRLQLLPSMAHTMKSPAAGIAMMLDQFSRELAKSEPDLERLRLYTEEIKKPVFAVLTVSQNIMAEITARMDPENPVETDLLDFLQNQLPTLNQLAPKGIRVDLSSTSQSFAVPLNRSERTWLEIVVFNLVHNAIRFSPAGGSVAIRCGTNARGGFLSVSDQGPGVPPEDRERIFDLFFHTDVKGWPKGHGMGLYEVRRLLRQLGWQIVEENIAPHGANFEIQIPANWRKDNAKSKGTASRR